MRVFRCWWVEGFGGFRVVFRVGVSHPALRVLGALSLVLFVGGPCRVFLDLRFGGPFGGPRVDSLGSWVCVCVCMHVCLFCFHLRDTVSVACVPAYIHMHAVHVYITVCACMYIYIYISLSLSLCLCVRLSNVFLDLDVMWL